MGAGASPHPRAGGWATVRVCDVERVRLPPRESWADLGIRLSAVLLRRAKEPAEHAQKAKVPVIWKEERHYPNGSEMKYNHGKQFTPKPCSLALQESLSITWPSPRHSPDRLVP